MKKYEIPQLNLAFGIVGMIGVWLTTHNWWAMFWAFVAAQHLTFTVEESVQKTNDEES